MGLNYMNGLSSLNSGSGTASSTTTNAFGESLRIANTGFYIVSPLLFNGSLAVDLQLNQDRSRGTEDGSRTQGRAIGYSFDSTILPEKPYPVSIFANRSQTQTLQPSGGRMVGVNENRGMTFQLHPDSILNDWDYPWVEANLEIRRESSKNTISSFGRSSTNEEQNREVSFSASKGFETADLILNARLDDRKNPAFSQGNFQSRAAGLAYSVDFGPTLNRRFDAKLDYSSRNGASPSTMITSNEKLQIDHNQSLHTDYSYDFSRQKSGDATNTMQKVGSSVKHHLYKNLTTIASVNASKNSLPNGSIDAYDTQFSQSYNHSLPNNGTFNASWSGGYQRNRNHLSSSNISVIDEPHLAQAPFSARIGFLLGHKFVVAGSIVVLNVKNGGRVPLRDVATAPPGLGDYEVIVEVNETRIVPLPTSLLVAEGDPLAVSYSYQVDASLDSETKSLGFGLGVDFRWISMSFSHHKSAQTALNQTASQFLQNTQQDMVQIGLKGILLKIDTNAQLSLEHNKASDTDNVQAKLSTGAVWDVDPQLHATLDLRASQASYTFPDRHTTAMRTAQSSLMWPNISLTFGLNASESIYTWPAQRIESLLAARTSLNWFTAGGWTHTASLDWSSHTVSPAPPETLVQLMCQSSVTLGKLSLNASIGLGQWLRDRSRAINRSLNLSAVRQF